MNQEFEAPVSKPSPLDEDGGRAILEGCARAVRSAGDGFGAVMDTVSGDVSYAIRGTGSGGVSVLEAVTAVARASLRRSLGLGGDLVQGTRAILMGVVRGTGERDADALKSVSHAARTMIRQTVEMRGDARAVAEGLVLGALAGAADMGVEPVRAANAVAASAAREADRIGPVVGGRVRAALDREIGGIRVVIPESLDPGG